MTESDLTSREYTHDHEIDIDIVDCGEPLEELNPEEFVLEPMYFKWGFADVGKMELRSGVVKKLREAQQIMQTLPGCEGWRFKIWDGFRTLKTQEIIYYNYYEQLSREHPDWDDEQLRKKVGIFVSPASENPKYPAPHNTGGTIDLTIIDAAGNEINMGTPFDEFTERTFTNHFEQDSGEIHKNRMLFKKIMEEAGFVNYFEEWWHFSYGDQEWALAKGETKAIYGSIEL